MYIDMHIHTEFSDGTYSPEEVAQIAKKNGVSIISVCDHDTIGAYESLRPACAALGITLIQGVEISTDWGGKNLHLLAYNFDPNNVELLKIINSNQAEYMWEGLEIIRNMEKDYPEVSLDEFTTYKKPRGRGGWASINYICDKGFGENLFDAFKYVQLYAPPLKFGSVVTACSAIRAAGGVPVLAHPGDYWGVDEIEERLTNLLPAGIGGLECYHPSPKHDEAMVAKCVEFCKTHDLCITSGGDSHGDFAQGWRGIGILKMDTSKLNLNGILNNWQ